MTTIPWATREKHDRAGSAQHAALLAAAREAFEDNGYATTTVADITHRAGVSRATFYVYFASKHDVFAHLAHGLREELRASQSLTPDQAGDVRRAAVEATVAYLDAYTRNVRLLTVLQHQALTDPVQRALLDDIEDHTLRTTTRFIERAVAEHGLVPAAPPRDVARAAGGMVAAYAAVLHVHPDRHADVARHVGAMFVRLLGIPEAAGRPAAAGRGDTSPAA
ncbi:putative transcriptional regulator, TetR family protein [Nostocoides japonicum T1-X7]|uniref:Putative transcriptional regulator, TetR family protein n=1 Tax=Nostocoides japonicum T1-X7 TaxID=1194083 RepID=A0A077LWN1_9MICO|nr:TetR/AcrR family transcriptional regulator [Tetrasphaera japonica]CCH76330.1 putative transcriptional regulator, TetR family protein [Tetrasphaera japonica T1-X7]